jgi:hypothetical protein
MDACQPEGRRFVGMEEPKMKNGFITLAISMALVLMSALAANAQTDQTSTSPPLSQPLVREGDFAMKLADSLKLGTAADETEAESALSSAGIAPRNGWIADYPITPDIVGELQAAVSEAAESGGLAMGKDEALSAFQNVITQYNLDVKMDTSGRDESDTSGTEYPDSSVMNNYYSEEGPPVVTYYAPPPDYAYLYTWVSYPFWWWDSWFPGFFVLVDFDVRVHGHGHEHDRGHGYDDRGHGDRGRGHGESVSNHFRDPRSGKMSRIDPTSRFRGGTFPARGHTGWSSPSAQSGARSIYTRRAPSGRVPPGTATTGRELRGYGNPRSSVGTRSSVFDRSVNRGVERSSSDRGFQSRTNAGQIRGRDPVGRGGSHGSVTRGGGSGVRGGSRSGVTGGSRGSAPGGSRGGVTGGSRGGTGGFHGGGRR